MSVAMLEDRLAHVREIFIEEARLLLEELARDLEVLHEFPGDATRLGRLRRVPHTLASAATLLGARDLARLCGLLEAGAERLSARGRMSAAAHAAYLRGARAITELVAAVERGAPGVLDPKLEGELRAVLDLPEPR